MHYSCGLHPSLTGAENRPDLLTRVATELASGLYDAVGETGLDWVRMYAPEAVQRDAFTTHLKLAALHNLPVIVHNRGADEACSEMLAAAELPRGGIMHCFSSGPEWVERFVDLGMYISFAGNSTFRNAPELREAMRHVPAERLLLETDAPFLSPHPLRGRPNHPARVVHIAAVLAAERSLSLEDALQLTSRNLTRLLERT
jgi:TatD DNase family protein